MMNQWVQHSLLSLFKKENKVDTNYPVVITVDGNTYNFTQDSLTEYIKHAEARKDAVASLQSELSSAFRTISNTRQTVYSFFNDRHTTGDTELEIEVSDINELLDEIGADKLKNLYRATVTITVTVDNIEATDEDEIQDIIGDELQVDVGLFSVDIQDFNVDEIIEA